MREIKLKRVKRKTSIPRAKITAAVKAAFARTAAEEGKKDAPSKNHKPE